MYEIILQPIFFRKFPYGIIFAFYDALVFFLNYYQPKIKKNKYGFYYLINPSTINKK